MGSVQRLEQGGPAVLADQVQAKLKRLADPQTARILQGFFKTGPGQYGEGDVFLGIKVPPLQKLAREFRNLSLTEAAMLLGSRFHEARLLALLILVQAFAKADPAGRKAIYDLYLARTRHVNNWDLVDASAPAIVGGYLADKERAPLYSLAKSASLWERRIGIVATLHFIRRDDFADTLKISALLLADREDLIHKAAGWMLREVGKRDVPALEGFLAKNYRRMPRTMLRYAIERFPEPRRRRYLKGEF